MKFLVPRISGNIKIVEVPFFFTCWRDYGPKLNPKNDRLLYSIFSPLCKELGVYGSSDKLITVRKWVDTLSFTDIPQLNIVVLEDLYTQSREKLPIHPMID